MKKIEKKESCRAEGSRAKGGGQNAFNCSPPLAELSKNDSAEPDDANPSFSFIMIF